MRTEPTDTLPMERRYRNPGYVPFPGSRYRTVVEVASRTLSYVLFGLAAGSFFRQPVSDAGWTFTHSLAAAGALLGIALIVSAAKDEPKREIDATNRRLFFRPRADRIFAGLGITLNPTMDDEQISRAVELKWELDALDRSQLNGISDGYEAQRQALIDQIELTLYDMIEGN